MGKEEFKALSRELLPLFEQMQPILREHGVENLASVTMDTEGYLAFTVPEANGMELIRCKGDDAPRIKSLEEL